MCFVFMFVISQYLLIVVFIVGLQTLLNEAKRKIGRRVSINITLMFSVSAGAAFTAFYQNPI